MNHRVSENASDYTLPCSVTYGHPGAEAYMVATIDEAGVYPATFVYEAGAKLVDDSVAPAPRIGLFLGQGASIPDPPGLASVQLQGGRSPATPTWIAG